MTTLVTGSHGYIGSAVLKELDRQSVAHVTCDAGWFHHARTGADDIAKPDFPDFTKLCGPDFAGVDTVIHLAAYSNDPTAALSPATTMLLNFHATVHLAKTARAAGVGTFVFSSSCSVFGDSHSDLVDERSVTNPLTPYALSKKRAEDALLELQTPTFRVAILRGATAFGASDVPRTDLLLNEFCAQAALGRSLTLNSLGTSWRPFMPISDFARALVLAAREAPRDLSSPPVWNVAPPHMQMTVREATRRAATVANVPTPIPPSEAAADKRSYRVDGRAFLRAYQQFTFNSHFEDEIADTIQSYATITSLAADLSDARFVRLASLDHEGRMAG